MTHSLERVKLFDSCFLECAVAVGYCNVHSLAYRSAVNATHGNSARVFGIVKRCDEHLGRTFKLFRRRNCLQDGIEKIGNVVGGMIVIGTHPTLFGRTVNNREIKLIFRGIERTHKVERHFVNLLRTTVGLIHFVNYYYGFQANAQRFFENEPRLRHGTFKSINKQNTSVRHV